MSLALTPAPARPVPLPARPRRGARAGELLLADVLEREARAPQGRIAVVVRLSRLPPPGPRPYHRRVARALLEDCAQRHGGQVLQLNAGDLVLVAPAPPRTADPAGGPLAMPGLLARLLHIEEQGAEPAAFAVTLAEGAERLRALLDDTAAPHLEEEAVARPRNPFAGRLSPGFAPLAPDALARVLSGGTAELLQRHAVARLPARGEPASMVRTTHQMLAVDGAQLAARLAHRADGHALAGAELPADPWLARHIDAELGRAKLALLRQAWGSLTPADAAPRPGVAPPMLRLPLGVLAGEEFAAFAALPHGDRPPAIAVAIAEAAADARAFAAVRMMLREAGMTLVLDGLTHHALVLARPEMLEPDLVALAWSGALPRLAEARREEVATAIARIGPARLLLTGADSEPALRWGRAMGIQLFQGAHVDAMLAATRQLACPHAAVCGLRACTQRALAATAVGRAGCARPDLLDGLGAEGMMPKAIAHRREAVLPT
jgi:hypothetical protein